MFKTIVTKLGIRLALSTAYHAQTNGASETLNNVLGTYLKASVSKYKDDWPMLAPLCALYYNTSASTALGGRTPAEVKFGFKVTFPFQIAGGEEGEESEGPLKSLEQRQKMVLQSAKDSLSHYKDMMIKASTHEDKDTRSFKVGDKVMVSTKALFPKNLYVGNKKTSARFLGPYEIEQVMTPGHAYKVKLPPKSRAHPVINISYLKYVKETDEFIGRPSQEVDEEQDNEQLYLIDKILKHFKKKGQYYFRVRWDRYGPEYDTWEPEESFRLEDGTIVNEVLLEYLRDKKISLS